MTLILELPDNKEAALKAKAQAHGVSAEHYAEQVLNRDLDGPRGKRSVSAIIREIWSDLPDDARAKLPADGASQIDHYVYGVPKRDQ
jgi:plasmid stability protein